VIASQFERFGNRVGYSRADTAANHCYSAKILDFRRVSQGTENIVDGLAWLEGVEHHGALADGLDDQCDGACLGIVVNDGQGYAFAPIAKTQDDELTSFGFTGNEWGIDDILIDLFG